MSRKYKLPLLFCIFIPIVVSGCSSFIKTPTPHIEIVTPEAHFMTYGIRNGLEYETVYDAVVKMSPAMQRAIRFISIYADNDPHIEKDAAAHCHNGRTICTRREDVGGWMVYHETAHARANQIPYSATHAWAKRSASIYGRKDLPRIFPWRGIVTEYGATNYKEDIAEWVRYVILIAEDGYVNLFKEIDKTDPVWMWKLNFLLEWEFITQKQHNKVAPILQ